MPASRQATVRASVGASESFDTVEAAVEAADRARAGLDASCDLAVVFASGQHLGMAKWLLSEVHDRLEAEADTFHEAIRAHYLAMATGNPQRYLVVDGTSSPEQIHAEVLARLRSMGVPG